MPQTHMVRYGLVVTGIALVLALVACSSPTPGTPSSPGGGPGGVPATPGAGTGSQDGGTGSQGGVMPFDAPLDPLGGYPQIPTELPAPEGYAGPVVGTAASGETATLTPVAAKGTAQATVAPTAAATRIEPTKAATAKAEPTRAEPTKAGASPTQPKP